MTRSPIGDDAGKAAAPERLADDDDLPLGLILLGQERAALGRAGAKQGEDRGRHLGDDDALGMPRPGELRGPRAVDAQVREGGLILVEVEVVRRRHAEARDASTRG